MIDSSGNLIFSPFWQVIFAIILLGVVVYFIMPRVADAAESGDDPTRRELRILKAFAWVLAPIWAGLIVLVLFSLVEMLPQFNLELAPTDLRWLILSIVALITALGGLVSAPLALIRVFTTERQTTTAEQGHITDRINKAVEGLGATKTEYEDDAQKTVPNIEVRIGAIFALERISQDSPRDHVQIMEILTAYIRENAPLVDVPLSPFDYWHANGSNLESIPDDEPMQEWVETLEPPSTDIQAAMSVIGRRGTKQINKEKQDKSHYDDGYRLDLRDTNLTRIDINGLNFANAIFDGAHLQGAYLVGAHLERANLDSAHLERANLDWAHLERANLSSAHLEGANLSSAHLERAFLDWAHLERANLIKAHLQGAYLRGAHLQGAYLVGAHLEGARLSGAHLDENTSLKVATLAGAAFRKVSLLNVDISIEQVKSTFGDASVTRPNGMNKPTHWDDENLDLGDFLTKWREWQKTIGYTPPEK